MVVTTRCDGVARADDDRHHRGRRFVGERIADIGRGDAYRAADDPRKGGRRTARAHAGHHLEGDPRGRHGPGLRHDGRRLERVTRNEAREPLSLERELDERRHADLVLEDDVGLGDALRRPSGAKARIAWARAHEREEAGAHTGELRAHRAGAHVETPAPTIRSERCATVTIEPSDGSKRWTIVPEDGAVNV